MSQTQQIMTIANGASESDVIDLAEWRIAGIIFPSAWTAAELLPQGYAAKAAPPLPTDGVGYIASSKAPIKDRTGAVINITAAASTAAQLDPDLLTGFRFVSFKSVDTGDHSTAVNQGGARSLTVLLVPRP